MNKYTLPALRKISLLSIVSFLLAFSISFAQFGKNKVQYQTFDWKYIESEHFDIYFYDGEQYLAEFVAVEAERALASIMSTLSHYTMNKRTPIVVYNTHNEFQQTNVINQFMPEGVGGVTELFKNRVVLPFQGDFAQFRHVTHHELVHAVMNDLFYGGTFQTAISSGNPFMIPIWISEGLAEWESIGGLDVQTDMFMRDATLNERVEGLQYMNGYYAYRGGQSFFWYVAKEYGEPKVGEFINRLKIYSNLDEAFKSSFGKDFEEFSDQWVKDMKKYYWPDIDRYVEPDEFSERLTDHEKLRNFYNTSPAISPDGKQVAYIADDGGVFGIFIKDLDDPERENRRQIISSGRRQDFEDLNLLTPGISWNPDGSKIAISAKSGGEDAIYIYDLEKDDYEKKKFGIKSISSVAWSPDGNKLAFIGVQGPQSDVFVYNFDTDRWYKATDDIFTDAIPVWAQDSRTIYFTSDRGGHTVSNPDDDSFKMYNYDLEKSDIYSVDIETRDIERITNSPEYKKYSYSISPDGDDLLFVFDKNGIGNIYIMDLGTKSTRAITNSLTGISQISLSKDASKLIFSTLYESGYDIFMMKYPFEKVLEADTLPKTNYRLEELKRKSIVDEIAELQTEKTAQDDEQFDSYGDFRVEFTRQNVIKPNPDASDKSSRFAETRDDFAEDTNFVVRDYKLKFSPDLVYGNPYYSTYFGFQGLAQMLFSDVLGDHRILVQANLLIDLRNSSFDVTYSYLPEIIDYSFSGYHRANFVFRSNDSLYRFRDWGLRVGASYPFDLFNRVEWGLGWMNLSMENVENSKAENETSMLFVPRAAFVHDDVLWSYFAPVKGTRYNFGILGSPKFSEDGVGFMTLSTDIRHYIRLFDYFNIALRGAGGASLGPDPRNFYLGGEMNWINRRWSGGYLPFDNPEDFAFMNFIMPLRGFAVNEISGTKYFVANLEFRYPMLAALLAGPVPILFQNVMGNFFLDVGAAWDDELNLTMIDETGSEVTDDLLFSTGLGARAYVLGLPLKFDVAWTNNFKSWSQPQYIFSLGLDF